MAKNPLPSYNWFASDWLGSRAHAVMTLEQQGAYRNLLDHAWESDPPCSLPDDDSELAQLSGAGKRWSAMAAKVRLWFSARDGRLWNERMAKGFERALQLHEARKLGGKHSKGKPAQELRDNLSTLRAELEHTRSLAQALLKVPTSTPTSTPTKDLLENILPSMSSVPVGTTTEPIAFALEEKEQPITADELMETWNEVCVPLGLSKLREMRGSRRKNAQLRIREHPKPEFWQQVFAGFKRSVFLQGRVNGYREGHKTWKASFDWMVANDLNCVKVMEDRYDG